MKRIKLILLILLSVHVVPVEALCCTTAIFSGKVTADGRPIIWKNRDTGFLDNRVEYVPASDSVKYSFIYLSNSADTPEAWSGVNSAGFSIMNSVSYNIRKEADTTPESKMDREGIVMYRALACCETIQDFEKMLDSLEKPMGLETNFGVIDACGGAAYYEVNNYTWIKYDVNEAPQGYLIRSNYSFSGRDGQGKGYVRYDNASINITGYIAQGGRITPCWVMDNLSRSFYQSHYGYNPLKEGYNAFIDKDFIPRHSTSAVTIVQGVKPGEDKSLAVMWCALGYPPVSQIIPLMVSGGDYIPADMKSAATDSRSAACTRAGERRSEIFFKNPDGETYVDLIDVRRYLTQIKPLEDKIFDRFNQMHDYWREKGTVDTRQLKEFYEAVEIR